MKCHPGFEESLGHIHPKVSPETQSQAAFEAINRTIPERAQEFSVEVDPNVAVKSKDLFQVTTFLYYTS